MVLVISPTWFLEDLLSHITFNEMYMPAYCKLYVWLNKTLFDLINVEVHAGHPEPLWSRNWWAYDEAFRSMRYLQGWARDFMNWELWLQASQSSRRWSNAKGAPLQSKGRARHPSETRPLLQLLDSFNLVQHVKDPTHTAGHFLDFVIIHSHRLFWFNQCQYHIIM